MSDGTSVEPPVHRKNGRHVWIVNHHALIPSKDGGSGRHLNMAQYLPHHGWSASLLVASTIHARGAQAMKGVRFRRVTHERGVRVLWVRATAYGQSTLRRIIGMCVFASLTLLPGMTKGLQRPDVVMGSTVHLLAAWAGWRLARRHNVPFVYEIRDVWPDTLIHLGRMERTSRLAQAMEALSLRLAERASLVVSPLPNVDRYLQRHGIEETDFLWVSNGFDGELEVPEPDYPQPDGQFTFMYLGAHGQANALEGILKAFGRACALRPDAELKLRLVGSGPLKSKLFEYASTMECSTGISFEDRIPEPEVIARAREADCLVANMHDSPVYEYGVSLNKIFTYLYAFRPVVFACSVSNPILESGAGTVVPGDDTEALARAMVEMYDLPHSERLGHARRGYEHVLENYSHQSLAERMANGFADVKEEHRSARSNGERS